MQTLATPMSSLLATQTQPTGERRRQTVARLLGATTFTTIPWQMLLQNGVLVRLRIGRCRFSTRLLLEDLGIPVADETVREKLSTWLVLGEKRLLPDAYMKALARIESSARALLKEHAFRTELGAFVPVTAYRQWRDGTAALREEYLALRDEILANHHDLVRQVVSEYEVIAADTYQRLCASHPELVTESREQFVATYCTRLAAQIPSPARIRETFAFQYLLVDGLSQLGTLPEEASIVSEDETAEERAAREQDTEKQAEDTTEPLSAQALRQHTARYARQRQMLASDLRHHARARIDSALDSFLSTLIGQLRTLVYDAACDVLATLERRGDSFAPRSVIQLNHLLTQIRSLNFFGDTEIEQMLARVEAIVALSPADRKVSVQEIKRTLRAIATTTRSTLLDLDIEPRQARDLGIPDLPTEQLVRQARAELDLPLSAEALAAVPAAAPAPRAEFAAPSLDSLWAYAEHGSATRSAAPF